MPPSAARATRDSTTRAHRRLTPAAAAAHAAAATFAPLLAFAVFAFAGCDDSRKPAAQQQPSTNAAAALAAGGTTTPGAIPGVVPVGIPNDLQEYVVALLEEVARKRMDVSEKFVAFSKVTNSLRTDREILVRELAETEQERDALRKILVEADAAKSWPVLFEGRRVSRDILYARLKLKFSKVRELSAKITRYAADMVANEATIEQIRLALDVLNENEKKIERDSRDLGRIRATPDVDDIAKVLREIDIEGIIKNAGLDKPRDPSAPQVSDTVTAPEADIADFIRTGTDKPAAAPANPPAAAAAPSAAAKK